MKNKSIVAFFLCLTLQISAQDLGKVVIRSANASVPAFIVSMNGVRVTNTYTNQLSFPYLDENVYKIKVLFSGSAGVYNFNLSSEPNYVSKYILNKDNFGNYNLMLESKSLLSMEPQEPIVPTRTIVAASTGVVNPVTQITTTVSSTSNPTTVATPSVIPPPTNVVVAMDDADFKDRLASVNKENFDRERLAKAKNVFGDENMTTGQVRTVMKVFNFDDSKLDFAKFAYTRTIDQKNYYKVEDELSFSSYKKQLSDYVKSKK